MKNDGVVDVDLGGKLRFKTGIGNIVLGEGRLDITWVDEEKTAGCLQFAFDQRRFAFTLRLSGAIDFEIDDARVRGLAYYSESLAGTLHLDFM